MPFEMLEDGESGTVIKVVGVGGAGGNALENMIRRQTHGEVEFIAANTDRQALQRSKADKIIQLGLSGLGAGSRPEMGAQAANEAREEIANAIRGANMVFITAGMGGGTGTGASPIVAEVAQELGILTVAVVTKPFSFEGSRRMKNAQAGLAALRDRVHSLIVILNDKLEEELGEDATMLECFEAADNVLYNACSGIAEIIHAPGLVNADFEDVRTVMSERGTAMMGAAEAEGEDRAANAASLAIACPLLEGVSLNGARGVLVNITAGRDLRQSEVRTAMTTIKNFADPDAHIVMGAVFDDEMIGKMRVTVIATGLDQTENPVVPFPTSVNKPEPVGKDLGLGGMWSPTTPVRNEAPAASGVDLFGEPIKVAKPVSRPHEPARTPMPSQERPAFMGTPSSPAPKATAQEAPAPTAPVQQAQPPVEPTFSSPFVSSRTETPTRVAEPEFSKFDPQVNRQEPAPQVFGGTQPPATVSIGGSASVWSMARGDAPVRPNPIATPEQSATPETVQPSTTSEQNIMKSHFDIPTFLRKKSDN